MTATFFRSAKELRTWLRKHHASATELWLGMYKKASGKGGITYKDALDEALCFGWIDGVRKRLDAEAFVQRFSPRTPKSYWSAVNTKRAQELIRAKRMAAPGRRAFEARDAATTKRYSFEREAATFDTALLKKFKANKAAWSFFESQPPYYRKVATFYVMGAKKEETRQKRLDNLIAKSAAGQRIL